MRRLLIGVAVVACAGLLSPVAALAQGQAGPPPGMTDEWLLHHRGAAPAPRAYPPGGAVQGRPYAGRAYGDHWRYQGYGVGAGIAGLAAGALVGGALVASQQGYYQPPADDYYADAPVGDAYRPPEAYPAESPDAEDYCIRTYRSYDPRSGTYMGYDGYRHPCP